MISRERVLTALAHEEPDRVPMDLGGTVVSSIAIPAYAALRDHLGLPSRDIRTLEVVQQIARVDEDVIERFGLDCLPVLANPPDNYRSRFERRPDGDEAFCDEFGATLIRPPSSCYYDWREFPLAEPSREALSKMSWPDPADPGRFRGLREQVQKLRNGTDKALVGCAPCGHDLLNQLFRIRGMENGLMDLLVEQDFAESFLDRYAETICTAQSGFLKAVGDLIDVHFTADDLAGQSGPLIAPALWRKLIKPRQARILSVIKSHSKAKIIYHTCGAATEFLDDLVEIGVEVLNPVQVSAEGMSSGQLKKRFGKKLSFWGGGCDTQAVLGRGTPAEVRAEVRQRVADLAPGGGFVFNPVHNIQANVPPENITTMFDAAREYGNYARNSK